MDISQITESLYVASRIKGEHLEDVLQLDPDLIISMIVQRRPPRALAEADLDVLWLRTFDFPLIPIPLKTLKRGVDAALPVIEDGGRVVVFCEGGRHRSVAMASCIQIGLGHTADDADGQQQPGGGRSLCLAHPAPDPALRGPLAAAERLTMVERNKSKAIPRALVGIAFPRLILRGLGTGSGQAVGLRTPCNDEVRCHSTWSGALRH